MTHFFSKVPLSFVLFTLTFFQAAQAQNLITNGSFENGTPTTCVTGSSGCFSAPGDCYFCNSTSTYFIPGWYLSTGNVDRFKSGGDSGADLYPGVPDSAWGLDMNGNAPATIYQDISGLTSGSTYELSFYVSNNTKSASCPYDKPLRVTVFNAATGTEIMQTDYSTAGLSTATNTWGYRMMSFVSPGTAVRVQFQSLFGDAATVSDCGVSAASPSFFGPTLDNVKMLKSATLPVNLISFSAAPHDDGALISWVGANESDLQQYEVLYSEEGSNFSPVNTVPAERNIKNSYTFKHHTLGKQDKGFYRLKCIKLDGSLTFSEVEVVYYNTADVPYQVWYTGQPGVFKIAGTTAGDVITVVDMMGRQVYQLKCNGGNDLIKLDNRANGLYLLKVTSTFQTIALKIFVTAN